MLVENNEAGISARQTRQRSEQDLAVSQLGYLASPAHQAATAQVCTVIRLYFDTVFFRKQCFSLKYSLVSPYQNLGGMSKFGYM